MADENEPTADEAKDRFREALERKKAAQHGGESHVNARRGAGPATSNQKATRMYRRKAGGS